MSSANERVRHRKRRADFAARGVCYKCGRTRTDGYKSCSQCRDRAKLYQRTRKQQRVAYMAAQRETRKQRGVCTYCGRQPARVGLTMCAKCAATDNARSRLYRATSASFRKKLRKRQEAKRHIRRIWRRAAAVREQWTEEERRSRLVTAP